MFFLSFGPKYVSHSRKYTPQLLSISVCSSCAVLGCSDCPPHVGVKLSKCCVPSQMQHAREVAKDAPLPEGCTRMFCLSTKLFFDEKDANIVEMKNGRPQYRVDCPWKSKSEKSLVACKFASNAALAAFKVRQEISKNGQ